jgi:hypothetical protein
MLTQFHGRQCACHSIRLTRDIWSTVRGDYPISVNRSGTIHTFSHETLIVTLICAVLQHALGLVWIALAAETNAGAIRGEERALNLVKGGLATSTRGHSADGNQGYGGDAC